MVSGKLRSPLLFVAKKNEAKIVRSEFSGLLMKKVLQIRNAIWFLWFITCINFASCKRNTLSKIFDEDFFFIFYDALAEQKIIIMAPTDVITEKYIGFLSLRFYRSNHWCTHEAPFYHKKVFTQNREDTHNLPFTLFK